MGEGLPAPATKSSVWTKSGKTGNGGTGNYHPKLSSGNIFFVPFLWEKNGNMELNSQNRPNNCSPSTNRLEALFRTSSLIHYSLYNLKF